jgi:hypothetical protein
LRQLKRDYRNIRCRSPNFGDPRRNDSRPNASRQLELQYLDRGVGAWSCPAKQGKTSGGVALREKPGGSSLIIDRT